MLYRIKAGHKAMACNDVWVKITSLFRKVENNVCKEKAKKKNFTFGFP